jgi:alpha-glucosidase
VTAASQPPLEILIQPEIGTLPVFVHGGSILPIAPLVQSTNEVPQGPLTLRVYAGDDCSLYEDDGRTYGYQHGDFLRMKFDCQTAPDGFHLHIGLHEGSYPAWWKSLEVEIYGWKPEKNLVLVNGKAARDAATSIPNGLAIGIPDDGRGLELQLQ